MRAVIQRVSYAKLEIAGELHAQIGPGLVILLGVTHEDTEQSADVLARKIAGLRIFTDKEDKMNLSVLDTGGQALVVSQFTLYADCRKGRRPAFIQAARPETANRLYEYFVRQLGEMGVCEVRTGVFGADMQVSLCNDGPVTICLDSQLLM